jgi:eukaryotic-like serine/threonine-protein kinase
VVEFSSQRLVRPGFRLDRYELVCPIAEGGMAEVWVARSVGEPDSEGLVAVKTILPQFASDERFQRMFLDEARLASRIQHPNVARVTDVGEEHEVLYIVMDWIDGEPVNRMQRALARRETPMPRGVALRIIADACAGLHAAHELRDENGKPAGVVHRDVSPHNILTSMAGVSKVIDFGIARAIERAASDLTMGTLKGRIHYMAPEQAMGQRVDRLADVWSVGAVLYHLFAGRPPYEGETQIQALNKLTSGLPPPPLPSNTPFPIAAIIKGALRHNPAERWQTAEEIQTRLERAMLEIGQPTTASTVAAFMAQHFGERSAARHRTIDTAIKAIRERKRAASRLPDVAPIPQATPWSATASKPGVAPGVASGLRPEATAKDSSSASLGSAAIDASPRPPRGPLTYFFAGAAVMAIGISVTIAIRPDLAEGLGPGATARVKPPSASSRKVHAASSPAPPLADSAPAAPPPSSGTATSAVPESGAPETVSVTDLPIATPPDAPSVSPLDVAKPPSASRSVAPPRGSASAAPNKKDGVDFGF